ncbi:putative toxin-antitoxin system toxin component, PIN family [Pseudomonas aeruginosa]|jgi:putative PIN family toxin of toxin-antitoxin system|uniref:putative toxin-antitoxin system toxin component, PIN family n=1 Tax=Pseudomonas aeruginosa TaxID=287 RepID=UPI001ADBE661|nr:putative toxin-antitoxin system toxin component, PIN family [Pseudomonas aeruginosa]MBO8369659.1 putative toxin-antitoxin system toxin component, PIN family [Pseudomonas aeruginosa]
MRRVVLDTNIVLSALIFSAGRLAWMRQAWQQQHLQPLVCRETVSELLRVLAYPKFKLSNLEQQELLADFLPYADVVELPAPWPDLPVCRDDKDQVFLVLAHVGKADALITGDADILAMREDFPGLIMTAEAFAARQA